MNADPKGTPKTLHEAIENGLYENGDDADVVCRHVVDFLAQRFSVAMLIAPHSKQSAQKQISDLYKATTGVAVK